MFSGSHKGGFKDTGGAATSPSILPVTTDKFQRSHLRNVALSPAFGGFTTGRCLWCLWCLSLSATLYPIISPWQAQDIVMPETDGTWLFPTRFEKNMSQIIIKSFPNR